MTDEAASALYSYWVELLSHPPFVSAIAAALEQALVTNGCTHVPHALLAQVSQTSRAYRDRETKANRDAYHTSQHDLASVMVSLDCDGAYSQPLLADIRALASGQRPSAAALRMPPKGSKPFADYVQRVHTARAKLIRQLRAAKEDASAFNDTRELVSSAVLLGYNLRLILADRKMRGLPIATEDELVAALGLDTPNSSAAENVRRCVRGERWPSGNPRAGQADLLTRIALTLSVPRSELLRETPRTFTESYYRK